MKVAYLGPAGTFSEEALGLAAAGAAYEPLPVATIPAAVEAVESGASERALVPFENSIEGTVRPTLDALAFDADRDRRHRQRLVGGAGSGEPQGLLRERPGGAEVGDLHPPPSAAGPRRACSIAAISSGLSLRPERPPTIGFA